MKQESGKNPVDRKLKQIVYVWHYLEWGGAQVYFLGIASRISGRANVRFVFPRGTGGQFMSFCEERGISYEFLDVATDIGEAPTLRRKIQRHWRKFRSEWATVRFLRRTTLPDVVHIEFSPWQSLFSLVYLCRQTEVFVTMHNALPPVGMLRASLWRLKFRIIAAFPSFHLFASNNHAKESLRPFVPPAFLERVSITYTNVNPDEIGLVGSTATDKNLLRSRFGLPDAGLIVVCLGQFIDRKGRWVFLDAARSIAALRDDITFVWISNSQLSTEENVGIDGYGLGARFRLIDSDSAGETHVELMRFLSIADIFTLPSFVEGLPISLLEAMALGIPVVSTNVYAIPEAVIDDETGLLIEPGDARGLADAIRRLADDPDLRRRLGESGREWVLERFNEISVADIAYEAYREAVGGNIR